MRTLEDVYETLAYHPATPDTAPVHDSLRNDTYDFAVSVWDRIPDGPEKTLAMRGLQDFLMHANCAVAMSVPIDKDTSAVARVLPGHKTDLYPSQVPEEPCQCGTLVIPAGFMTGRTHGSDMIHRRADFGDCG